MSDKTDVIINMAKDTIDKLEKSIDTCDPKVAVHANLAMGLIDGLDKKINSKEASETRVKIESFAWAFADKCSCTKK